MGKKKLRSKYTSKGTGRSVAKKNLFPERDVLDVIIAKRDAFDAGKKVWITIENPNKEETNKRFIRVKGSEYFKKLS